MVVVAVVDPRPREVEAEALAPAPAEMGMDALLPSRMAVAVVGVLVVMGTAPATAAGVALAGNRASHVATSMAAVVVAAGALPETPMVMGTMMTTTYHVRPSAADMGTGREVR